MKTALKSLTLGLLISSSCGFAGTFTEDFMKVMTPGTITGVVCVIAGWKAANKYVVKPVVDRIPVGQSYLEWLRDLLDTGHNKSEAAK